MVKIYTLVGMIASGKSSYCKNAAKQGCIIVNDDSIVNMLHGDDYSLYNNQLKVFYKSIENQIIATALCMGMPVIVDRGLNVSKSGRQRWLALAKSFDVPCEAIIFPHDGAETHAKRRTEHDGRGHPPEYWSRVAKIHDGLYSEPTVEEGFDQVHRIAYDEIISGRVINA